MDNIEDLNLRRTFPRGVMTESHGASSGDVKREEFEKLLQRFGKDVERFVKFKISPLEEAEDILQETYFTAYQKMGQLKNPQAFRAWILSIARNKCNDYFQQKASILEIPLDEMTELSDADGRMGIAEALAVRESLEKLAHKEKEILYLYFWKQLPQEEIAKRLGIPIGTVKSRLFVAKQKFKDSYRQGESDRSHSRLEHGMKPEDGGRSEGEGRKKGSAKSEGEGRKKGNAKSEGEGRKKGSAKSEGEGRKKGSAKSEGEGRKKDSAKSEGEGRKKGSAKSEGEGRKKGSAKSEGEGRKKGSAKSEGEGWKKGSAKSEGEGRKNSDWKGVNHMKTIPERMPKYQIMERKEAPFSVKWEELMGWFLVPRLGEELSWGMYDQPSGLCDHIYEMKVTGRAKVHGIEGVELTAREAAYSQKEEVIERTFIAQLTDTHCRYLATIRNDNGVRNLITFLDGEEFMECWGFGEDNCGNETNLSPKGEIHRDGNTITTAKKDFLLDIVGRYDVTICGKTYDTICVMDVQTYNNGVVSEQFLDRNGRTILWRRFNKNDWHVEHYGGKTWSEQLPDNDRLIVDGETYVQWYDCITDYIL